MSRQGVVLMLVAACVASGCVPPHVAITLPPRDAPMPERIAAYRTYRASSTLTTIQPGLKTDTLRLGNGEYVSHVEDLLPAVEPTSNTAEQIAIVDDYETPSNVLTATSSLSAIGWLVSIFAYGATESSTYARPVPLTLFAVSVASVLVNGFVLEPKIDDARKKAIDSYDDDLLARLRMQRKVYAEDAP
jgi:hypothetical protein